MSGYIYPSGFTPPSLLSGLPENAPILVGFSGGADSTSLLHMLSEYSKASGAVIYAAHINHCIRGDEADRDEEFCRSFAEKLGVKFFCLRADVPRLAEESGESIETAARRVRYDYFDRLMDENGIQILATAHNADDNLETVIFNIARGCGLGGVCGIPQYRPCKYGCVVRPILGMEKHSIFKYCSDNGLDFVTDSTNLDTDYTRNKIRSGIIPIMRDINSGAARNTYRMTQSLHEDELCLDSLAQWFSEDLGSDLSVETEKLCGSPAAVVKRVLIKLFSRATEGRDGTLEHSHIDALMRLAEKAVPHSSVTLPNGIEGVIENGRLCFRKKRIICKAESYSIPLNCGLNTVFQTNSVIFLGDEQNSENVYKNSTMLTIDSAKIIGALYARNRKEGDRIRMGGMSKSIKKMMCDKKIPLEQRGRIPVICDDLGVLAVPFLGIRDGACDKNFTEKKLYISFYMY